MTKKQTSDLAKTKPSAISVRLRKAALFMASEAASVAEEMQRQKKLNVKQTLKERTDQLKIIKEYNGVTNLFNTMADKFKTIEVRDTDIINDKQEGSEADEFIKMARKQVQKNLAKMNSNNNDLEPEPEPDLDEPEPETEQSLSPEEITREVSRVFSHE